MTIARTVTSLIDVDLEVILLSEVADLPRKLLRSVGTVSDRPPKPAHSARKLLIDQGSWKLSLGSAGCCQ
jgi:hypothetical protein